MQLNEIYKCNICGNIVEMVHVGGAPLVCCDENMKLQEENTVDAALEKHVPVVDAMKVKVGSVEHPMEEEHYIEWIEMIKDGNVYRKYLKAGEKPEAEFCVSGFARAYCNLHGLWKSQ